MLYIETQKSPAFLCVRVYHRFYNKVFYYHITPKAAIRVRISRNPNLNPITYLHIDLDREIPVSRNKVTYHPGTGRWTYTSYWRKI